MIAYCSYSYKVKMFKAILFNVSGKNALDTVIIVVMLIILLSSVL